MSVVPSIFNAQLEASVALTTGKQAATSATWAIWNLGEASAYLLHLEIWETHLLTCFMWNREKYPPTSSSGIWRNIRPLAHLESGETWSRF
jgi:hypothetical protein